MSYGRWQDRVTINLAVSSGDWDPTTNPTAVLPAGASLWSAGVNFRMLRNANGAIDFIFRTADQDPMTGLDVAGTNPSVQFRTLSVFKTTQTGMSGLNWRGLVRLIIQIDFTQSDPQNAFTVFASDYDLGTGTAPNRRPVKCIVDTSTAKLGVWTPLAAALTNIAYDSDTTSATYGVVTFTTPNHGLRPGTWIQVSGVQSTPTAGGDDFWAITHNESSKTTPRLLQVVEVPDANTFRCYRPGIGRTTRLRVRNGAWVAGTGSWVQRHRLADGQDRGLTLGATSNDQAGPAASGADLTFWGLRFGIGLDYDASVARDAAMVQAGGSAANDLFILQGGTNLRSWGDANRTWWLLTCQEPYGNLVTSTQTREWLPRYPVAISRCHFVVGLAHNLYSLQSYIPQDNIELRGLTLRAPSRNGDAFWTGLYLNLLCERVRFDAMNNGTSFVRLPHSTTGYDMYHNHCIYRGRVFNIYIPHSVYTFLRGTRFDSPGRVVTCTIGGSLSWQDAVFAGGIVEHMLAAYSGDNAGAHDLANFNSNIPESESYAGTPFFIQPSPYAAVSSFRLANLGLDKGTDRPWIDIDEQSAGSRGVTIHADSFTGFGMSCYVRTNGSKSTGVVIVTANSGAPPRLGYAVHTGLYGPQSNVGVMEAKAGVTSLRYATSVAPVSPSL